MKALFTRTRVAATVGATSALALLTGGTALAAGEPIVKAESLTKPVTEETTSNLPIILAVVAVFIVISVVIRLVRRHAHP